MSDINESVKEIHQTGRSYVSLIVGILLYGGFYVLSITHQEGTPWGWMSILPTLTVLVLAIVSHHAFESIIAGGLGGLIMLNSHDIITPFADNISKVMGNETIVWLILVCCLMGGFIRIIEISGCLDGFTEWLKTKIKTRRQSTVATVVLGAVVFIDDYLSCLAVSSSVKKLTDFYKVSREKIAYLIDSAAAPMCVIVPVSTWAVFFAGLLEENGVAGKGEGMNVYVSSIPFMAYAWLALAIALLVGANIIGDFGPMKKAEARAKAGQPVEPEFQSEDLCTVVKAKRKVSTNMQLFNFFFPMILLVAATVYYDIDLLRGVIIACAATVALFYIQGILSFKDETEALFEGFHSMLYPISTVISGFILKEINDSLGMTQYVIDSATPYLSQATYPAVVFLLLAIIVFSTASSWGTFVLAIPIVVPIALNLGVYMPLVVGALLSASSFGSHACFFSDSSLLASQGAGCSPMAHAFSQFPYALMGAILAFVAFLFLGYAYA